MPCHDPGRHSTNPLSARAHTAHVSFHLRAAAGGAARAVHSAYLCRTHQIVCAGISQPLCILRHVSVAAGTLVQLRAALAPGTAAGRRQPQMEADADARMFRKPSQLSAVYHVTCNRIDGAPHESVCGEASDHATHVPRHVYRPYFIILPLPGTTWLWIQSPSAFMPAILCQRVLNVSQHRARRARRGWGCQCEP